MLHSKSPAAGTRLRGRVKVEPSQAGFAEHLERKNRSAKPILLPLRSKNGVHRDDSRLSSRAVRCRESPLTSYNKQRR
ncbi:MAG: hypothetical protein M5U10_06295 [Candidatus Methanoperedens sp.]|uniref:hypothetical protein n=1 Tax=Candidatus Methanoperedens nitratireducens TaxID=1392998 RepID=UPI0012FE8DC1|nr:hypothetical protein [Candidatus Methanoperedens nitroreducens]MDJ1421507.1 hypothetical protein [Candidatus Methanoperedens sp.]